MCVAALAWNAHTRWRLVAIANRDEYHDRPAAPLARWENGVIAGRDLQAGGTWLGVTDAGRFALVTNYRVEGYPLAGLASRGDLVAGWLEGHEAPPALAMNPFHLICADESRALHRANHPAASETRLAPGLHGVSNGAFDTPWPKTRRLMDALGDWLGAGAGFDPLFAALADETPLPAEADSEGPEQPFSPVFIRSELYGTRCSTVVALASDGTGTIAERRFDRHGRMTGETVLPFGTGCG